MSQRIRSVAWVLLSSMAAGIIAWLAVGLQLSGRGPLGIVSLGIGAAVGLFVVGIARMVGAGGRGAMISLAMALAFATVAAEHTFFYREYVSAWHKQRLENPALKIFRPNDRPKDFWTYMLDSGKGMLDSEISDRGMPGERASDFHRWILWLIDLVLVMFSASLVTFLAGNDKSR